MSLISAKQLDVLVGRRVTYKEAFTNIGTNSSVLPEFPELDGKALSDGTVLGVYSDGTKGLCPIFHSGSRERLLDNNDKPVFGKVVTNPGASDNTIELYVRDSEGDFEKTTWDVLKGSVGDKLSITILEIADIRDAKPTDVISDMDFIDETELPVVLPKHTEVFSENLSVAANQVSFTLEHNVAAGNVIKFAINGQDMKKFVTTNGTKTLVYDPAVLKLDASDELTVTYHIPGQ